MSSFGSAEITGVDLTIPARKRVPQVNPHINYLDLKHHVYTKVIVSPTHVDIRYIAVDTVSQPAAHAFLLQGFSIPAGESRLILQ